MSIMRFLNCKQCIKRFCNTYTSIFNLKPLLKDDVLYTHYWQELEHLYNHLETFYEATVIVKNNAMGLVDHF